jgi:hypothetical protein
MESPGACFRRLPDTQSACLCWSRTLKPAWLIARLWIGLFSGWVRSLRTASPGSLLTRNTSRIIIDTKHFRGNYPRVLDSRDATTPKDSTMGQIGSHWCHELACHLMQNMSSIETKNNYKTLPTRSRMSVYQSTQTAESVAFESMAKWSTCLDCVLVWCAGHCVPLIFLCLQELLLRMDWSCFSMLKTTTCDAVTVLRAYPRKLFSIFFLYYC